MNDIKMTDDQLEHYKQAYADSKFLIENDPNREIDEAKMMATFEHFITTIESQKEEIDRLLEREYNEYPRIILDLETRIFDLQDAANTQEAITELAVKGLREIEASQYTLSSKVRTTAVSYLNEIERLQNGTS